MSRVSTEAHLSAAEVFYLLTPLSGGPGVSQVLIFCDGSGQLGCCYPTYVLEDEDAEAIEASSPDRLVERWDFDGVNYVRRGGGAEQTEP